MTFADDFDSGELRANVFRVKVEDSFERPDVFFLIDKGSVPDACPSPLGFGVISVLPVGKRGRRFDWRREEVTLSERDGVEGCVRFTSVPSSIISVSGISEGNINGLLGGNGEGERGPRGRLSVECMEEGRDGHGDSIPRDGVVDLGVGVVER